MPIILNENEQTGAASIFSQKKKIVSPQFFSKSLTGSGKKRGLLNGALLPCIDGKKVVKPPIAYPYKKVTVTTGTSTFEVLPLSLYIQDRLEYDELPGNAECISPDTVPEEQRYYLSLTMDYMILATDLEKKGKSTYCSYDIKIICRNEYGKYEMSVTSSFFIDIDFITAQSPDIDVNMVNEYVNKLKVYDLVQATAELWDEGIPQIMNAMLETGTDKDIIVTFCRMLDNYSVNLTDYKYVYNSIQNGYPGALEDAANANLNILLNAKLEMLETIKPDIATFKPVPYTGSDISFSPEQITAITSPEPCCIVQAGAGTGKSTVINSRLKYLRQCGVDLKTVTVLSFTNAAANHISEIAPDVKSQTIASMIHDIYSANYAHNLSTPDTIINVLQADNGIMEQNPVAQDVIRAFEKMKENTNSGLVALSNIAGSRFSELTNLLDSIRQTTLELESIVCYHAADRLTENATLCRHLIMDEVQDNSIFEFIYIISYVIRHKASLYLVGDCSQTLYEFRASNPKALNCLEMSGVFECMQLQTNYRSNQNILDFANLILTNIEANQYARIQLHANDFNTRPFEDDVKVTYSNLPGISKLKEYLPGMLLEIKDWIAEKLGNNEQVTFLAYRRSDLKNFEDIIRIMFPQASFINIVPAKNYQQTFFSKYIRLMGHDYTHRAGNDAAVEIMRHIIGNKEKIGVYNDNADAVLKKSLTEWMTKNRDELMAKDLMLQNSLITMKDFNDYAFQTLIDYEIEKNALKLRLTSMRNQQKKEQDISHYNFVASTIHSAKGLEFDNVILLYNEHDSAMEETKRMYYVGLTRARQSEYILAYNAHKQSSNIRTAYEAICASKSAPDRGNTETIVNEMGETA